MDTSFIVFYFMYNRVYVYQRRVFFAKYITGCCTFDNKSILVCNVLHYDALSQSIFKYSSQSHDEERACVRNRGALFLFSIMPTFLVWERKLITNGMDFIWFCVLYIIAAYIRKYGLPKNVIHKWYLYGYILCSFVLALFRLPLSFISMHVGLGDKLTGILYSYNSIFVVVSSVLLFSFFLHVHVDNDRIKSIILKVSPLTFAVYLIHDHPMVRNVLWSSLPLRQWFDGGILTTLMGMVISVISIFVICCLVDKCRMVLFHFIGIEAKVKKLDAMWQKFIM